MFSHGSMDNHPLKATTINDPSPTSIGLSNIDWMEKQFLSLKLRNHCFTLMKPMLLYLYAEFISYIFRLDPRRYNQLQFISAIIISETNKIRHCKHILSTPKNSGHNITSNHQQNILQYHIKLSR